MHTSYTVIITTFNRNLLLQRSLKSVLDQSLQPKEIIIINNHNKDIKKKFKSKKIKYYNLIKNFGSANGRNIGASLAKGKFLSYLDDDDFWHKDYLQISDIYLKQNLPDILISKKILFDKRGFKIFKQLKRLSINDCFIKNPGIIGSNIIIKKRSLLKINGFDQNLIPSEDKSLIIDAFYNKQKIILQDNFIYYNNDNTKKLTYDYKKRKIGKINFYLKYRKYMDLKSKLLNCKDIIISAIKSYM